MPVFVNGEILELSMPTIFYHDGKTVMVPFRPIGENFWPITASIWPSTPLFKTIGGGSGKTLHIAAGGSIATGLGFAIDLGAPAVLVDGVIYVPLIALFASGIPWPSADAFIYSNIRSKEQHLNVYCQTDEVYFRIKRWCCFMRKRPYNSEIIVMHRGWGMLYGMRSRWSQSRTERPIAIDVSSLPIYVNGEQIHGASAILSDSKYDIMLPITSIMQALGYQMAFKPCGEIMQVNIPNARTF